MIRRNKVATMLCAISLLVLPVSGCSNPASVKDSKAEVSASASSTSIPKQSSDNLFDDNDKNNSTSSKKTTVQKSNAVESVKSPDSKMTVSICEDAVKGEAKLYFSDGEGDTEVKAVEGNLHGLTWSPDSKYFTVNEGTSTSSTTYIINAATLNVYDKVENCGGPIWSPDSTMMAFSTVSPDVKPDIETELSGTLDLSIYTLAGKTTKLAVKAQGSHCFKPVSWNTNGVVYEKTYFTSPDQIEKLIYKVANMQTAAQNQDVAIEITPSVFESKKGKLDVKINYPGVKMADAVIQQKVNTAIQNKISAYLKNGGFSDKDDFAQTVTGEYEITYKKGNILSVTYSMTSYAEGAAHPANYLDAVTLNLTTGETLSLMELFREDVNYDDKLSSVLDAKIKKLDYQLLTPYNGLDENQAFYLTPDSVVIFYQEYVYTPHALGPMKLEIRYDEIKDILKYAMKYTG